VLGGRFSDRVTGNVGKFATHAKILQIDIDVAEINKNVMVSQSITGDIKQVLEKINQRLEQQYHPEWMKKIESYLRQFPLRDSTDRLTGPGVVKEIYRQTKGEAVIVTEVGQHQMWAAQYYLYEKPRSFISSGGLGTMGFGLGAALGAKLGCPDKTVINIAGDGCFRMNLNEMATAVRSKIPIIQVVINNHVLGMVHQWQELFYEKRYSATILDDVVDFVKVAEAMGAIGIKVTTPEAFSKAFEQALSAQKPILIDCQIDCGGKVWPMVAPGAGLSEVFDSEDKK